MTMSIIPSGAAAAAAESLTFPQRIVTVNDSPGASDRVLLVQHAAPITISLPTGMGSDYQLVIKDWDGFCDAVNTITLLCGGLETIDLAATYTMDVPFMSVVLGCTGTGRYFIA
jgi:hypothetical protein